MTVPTIKGATSIAGNKWIRITQDGVVAFEPYKGFMYEVSEIKKRLAHQNIIVVKKAEWAEVIAQVEELRSFPRLDLVERTGWTINHFALPDGTVPGFKRAKALFEPASYVGSKGSMNDWLTNVAEPLVGQHFMSFLLMTAFAPTILQLTDRVNNFGFELVGKGGCGKSTALHIMASVCGPAVSGDGNNYWASLNATNAGLEKMMPRFNNLPMLLDEANLSVGSGEARAKNLFRQLIFQLADGRTKSNFFNPKQEAYRTIYVTSANQALASLIASGDAATNAAAADRLITLKLDERRPYGTFDFLPKGVGDGTQLASRLKAAIAENYGRPIRGFVKRLVKARVADEKALRKSISSWTNKFVAAVGADRNDGSATRVAEAFGIVYAAGELAKQYRVLPAKLHCLEAAISTYRLHLASTGKAILTDVLQELAAAGGVIKLDKGKLPKIPDAQLHADAIFIHKGKRGRNELLIHPYALAALRDDHEWIIAQARSQGLLICEDGRNAVYRKVRRKQRDRVLVFKLSG